MEHLGPNTMSEDARNDMFNSKWSKSTVLKGDIAHYRRARAKGPGADSDYIMGITRKSMVIHIHDQNEQANMAERKKLFHKGDATTIPDPSCAAVLGPKRKASRTGQSQDRPSCCSGSINSKECHIVTNLLCLQSAPEAP